MATGVSLQKVPGKGASYNLLISVHVYKEDLRWRVRLLPGCCVLNKTAQALLLAFNRKPQEETPHYKAQVTATRQCHVIRL